MRHERITTTRLYSFAITKERSQFKEIQRYMFKRHKIKKNVADQSAKQDLTILETSKVIRY